jgi:GH24 family phage-related lysozyme (muramidase)
MLNLIRKLLAGISRSKEQREVKSLRTVSPSGLFSIKKHEALRLEAYLPTPNDVWTIGYGHTKTAKKGMRITERGAEELLKGDIAWAEAAVRNRVKVPLNQNQFDALVSFVFNVGETAFASSTLLRLLNQGKYQEAADQLLRWDKQKGKVLRGLTRRRAEERSLFLK